MNRRTLCLALIAVTAPASAAADPSDLVKYIPSPVNTLCVVNVQSILSSPRAGKGKWDQIDHTEYLAGAVPVNPNVERLLTATEFAPSHKGRAGAVGVLTTKKPVDLAKLAASFGGEITTAGGEPAVT